MSATSRASRGRSAPSSPALMHPPWSRASETRQVRKPLGARVHVLAAELGAATQRGEHLAGVEAHVGIERVLDPMLDLEIDGRELVGHEIALLEADAVLARENPAHVDAELQDLGAER